MRKAAGIAAASALGLSACAGGPTELTGEESAGTVARGLIVEGEGVAGVRLGMTADEVEATLGPPERANRDDDGRPLYMSYHATENFGVYFNERERVRLLIVSVDGGGFCTSYGACLYREGDLQKIKSRHGANLLRFVDRDGSLTYRLLSDGVLTEWTPVEARNGVVQVAISYWDGPIDRSSLD
ncbi:MAG: hypothetical protein HXY23_00485 [Parvularculaceae bacterium]|jgi:outer membrane protein assembly factor BamE (lipoprotein component of BamABCDE complex)|nr:hypothetical protein [Parvularculaceae bacterium]